MPRPSTSDFRLGLIGYPLSHSLSPQIHTTALQSCGLQGDYSLFPVHPDDKQGLKELLARVRSGEIHGLNVTIPHKQNVIEDLDELTATAKATGAVNTIYLREDKLIGDNTDVRGFSADLKKFLTTETRREVCSCFRCGRLSTSSHLCSTQSWLPGNGCRTPDRTGPSTRSPPDRLPIINHGFQPRYDRIIKHLTHRQHHPFGHDAEHRPISVARKSIFSSLCSNLRFGLQST